jgi:polysaccharide chain length determinant protein (PEP-CTERM system associated)
MIENRELTMDDYLAMLRRRAQVIVIPVLVAPLLGYLAYLVANHSFAKYTSQSTILVEAQKVPENMVQPVVSEELGARMATLQQQVMSQSNLQPVVARVFPGKNSQQAGEIIDGIRLNMTVTPVPTDLLQIGAKKKAAAQGNSGGFYVNYTAPSAREAQQICAELTSLMMNENLKSVQAAAKGTSDVLSKGIEDAKRDLDDLDSKLAAFKREHQGQLPGDEESNLKILMGMNQQLEAQTQALNRDQQDREYTQSVLAQQAAAWRSTQASTNPQTLEKQLSDLQSQLLSLQSRYTADHPDVMKTKADIAEVKKKLSEVNKASEEATDNGGGKGSANEPPEIRQLRSQVHQLDDSIKARSLEQTRLQEGIGKLQRSVSLSPEVEERYNALTRDYSNALKSYQDLLAKKSTADLTVNMTNQAQGEQMALLSPASLPDSPSFPNIWIFTGVGLGAGLVLGIGWAMWLELRDQSIRTEADAEAALELPLLAAIPWVGIGVPENGNSKLRFWNRKKNPDEQKETVGVQAKQA